MTLDELNKEWSDDSQIDRTELGDEAIRIPQLHSKYFKLYSQERLSLRKSVEASKSLLRDLNFYYLGSLDMETMSDYGWEQNQHIILKTDVSMHIDANPVWVQSNLRIAYQQEKVDFLDSIIKSLNGRGFNISAAISWEKFKVGI